MSLGGILSAESTRVDVRLAGHEDASVWKQFLANSSNGTLFHDLDFLRYHPPGRFQVHNLILSADNKVIALLPGSLVSGSNGRPILRSPYGASFGGFVVGKRLALRHALRLVESLKDYAIQSRLGGIELILGPAHYAEPPHDLFAFALPASGFRLRQRWLNPMIPLTSDPEQALAVVSSKRKSSIRVASRDGVEVKECGPELLPEFYEVLKENRARHGAVPTHTLEELRSIFELVPDRVRLFLCVRGADLLGGTVVFELNAQAVYSFCPAHRDCFKEHQPAAVLLYRVLQHYGSRGIRYLDLGPTGSYHFDESQLTLNAGNAFFKEEMGGVAFHRDCWAWEQS